MYSLSRRILLDTTDKTYLQFLRYTLIGGFSFIVDISLLYGFTEYLNWYYLVSAGISFSCGLFVNFFLSRKVVFPERKAGNHLLELVIVSLISLVGLGINQLFVWYITEYIGLYYILSKVISAVGVYSWNFFARKYLVYR